MTLMHGAPPAVPATQCESRLTEKELDEAIRWGLSYAKKFCNRNPHVDHAEVESAALDGAMSAWKKFDPARGIEFFSLYSTSIKRRVLTAITEKVSKTQHWQRFGLDIELDRPIGDETSPRSGFGETVKRRIGECIPDSRVTFEENISVMHLLNQLPPDDRDIMEARIVYGLSCPETAEYLGGKWTPMRVWRAEKSALPRLRRLAGNTTQ